MPGLSPLRKSRLKARPFRERVDGVYGPLWEAAKLLPCIGLKWEPGHRCTLRHTAHHDPPRGQGGTDETGLIPCCESIHAPLDNRSTKETRSEMLARLNITELDVQEAAHEGVNRARRIQRDRGGLDW